jgi:hypothetical protein
MRPGMRKRAKPDQKGESSKEHRRVLGKLEKEGRIDQRTRHSRKEGRIIHCTCKDMRPVDVHGDKIFLLLVARLECAIRYLISWPSHAQSSFSSGRRFFRQQNRFLLPVAKLRGRHDEERTRGRGKRRGQTQRGQSTAGGKRSFSPYPGLRAPQICFVGKR